MASDTLDTVITRSQESDRPSLLPSAFEPLTRSLFNEAGLQPGMHVLCAAEPGTPRSWHVRLSVPKDVSRASTHLPDSWPMQKSALHFVT